MRKLFKIRHILKIKRLVICLDCDWRNKIYPDQVPDYCPQCYSKNLYINENKN